MPDRDLSELMDEQGGPGEEGISSSMIIGGVDLRDLQAAHAQHPILQRWHNTTLGLISDLHETKDSLASAVRVLQEQVAEKDARVKELESKYEPETEGSADPSDPEDAPPGDG